MKPILIFICFLPLSLFGQESFFKTLDFGSGGTEAIGIKDDDISRINPLPDGYLYQISTFSDTAAESVIKYVRVNSDFEQIWEVSFLADYTYLGEDIKYDVPASFQENILVDSFLYSLSNVIFRDRRGAAFSKINYHTGELIFNKILDEHATSVPFPFYFQQFNDSSFVFSGVSIPSDFNFVPTIVHFNQDGEILNVHNYNTIFPDKVANVISFNANPDSTFNILYYRWPENSTSTNYGWFHSARIHYDGTILHDKYLGDFTAEGTFAFQRNLSNGNRLVVTQIDTATSFVQRDGNVIKFYELTSDSELVRDTAFDWFSTHPRPSTAVPDTSYSLIDITQSDIGEIYVLFSQSTIIDIYDNARIAVVLKFDENGKMEWRKKLHPFKFPSNSNRLRPSNITMDLDGGIIVSGNVSFIIDTLTQERDRKGFIMKLDSNGCYNTNCEGGYLFTSLDEISTVKSEPLARISPNPTSDFIIIEPLENIKYSIRLFDIHGTKLHQEENVIGEQKIKLHNYPAGVYFIEVIQNRKRFTQQIIKQ